MDVDSRAQVWAKTNGQCWYCGKLMNPWEDFTIDHMDPRKQGGGDELSNLVPCCKRCNSRKHAKTVEEYRAYLQEKGAFRFWGEYVGIVQEDRDEVDDQDDCAACKAVEFYMALVRNYAPYTDPDLFLTLSALAFLTSNWSPSLYALARFTHQSSAAILAHLLRFEKDGFLSILWATTSQEPIYHLNIDALQKCPIWSTRG